jgi:GTPase Era involved in 16S rRNA processing
MTSTPARVDLTLISHTNVGKTTLARTLLRRDIGEVGDRPHVTDLAESDVLIESLEGDSLVLWDTPGFGDSARLFRRLQQAGQPVGWFLSQVWDRFTDRPFWCGQQAMRNARDSSDVILYVANASEQPSSAAYVAIEMQILEWLGKPVILLLNQLGPPGDSAHLQRELKQWEAEAARHPCVQAVLPFDAFARCWVQEGTLLDQVQRVLPTGKQASFERLREAWRQRNLAVFEHSMQTLAHQLAVIAIDSEPIVDLDLPGKARAWIGALSGGVERDALELQRAQNALATRLDAQVRAATGELVRLHGLSGNATEEVLQRLGHQFSVRRPADADKASVIGGLVSGALGGLAADLGAGGLTFGAGALIGGVLGAFGARGVARAYNLARGSEEGTVRWSAEFLESRLAAALMRYLAVAHFGRGRGDFVAGLAPAHWQEAVNEAVQMRRAQLQPVWAIARAADAGKSNTDGTAAALLPIVAASAREVLSRFYPDSMPTRYTK